MRKEEEAWLDPLVLRGRALMRAQLGFREETRMDEILFVDGTVIRETPDGAFVGVRRGVHPWESGELEWRDDG